MGKARLLFLRGHACIFVLAFASYYLQYPGILGQNGLLPIKPHWQTVKANILSTVKDKPTTLDLNVFPRWLWACASDSNVPEILESKHVVFTIGKTASGFNIGELIQGYLKYPSFQWVFDAYDIDPDSAHEFMAILGMSLGILGAAGIVHHILLYALLDLLYLSLYVTGQRWLSFQWDILLLEAGFLALLYCPVFSLRVTGGSRPLANLVHRVFFAKFMMNTGHVKVSAECPTWHSLTALEYHFASTCIPTREAWVAHSMHPFLLRLSVAIMFVEQLPMGVMFLVPFKYVRRVAVLVEIPLQLSIMATGNYNWLNLHTILLMLPAWDSDGVMDLDSKSISLVFDRANLSQTLKGLRKTLRAFSFLAAVGFFVFVFSNMFTVYQDEQDGYWRISKNFTTNDVLRHFDVYIFSPTAYTFLFLQFAVISTFYILPTLAGGSSSSPFCGTWRLLRRAIHMCFCFAALGVCILPWGQVHTDSVRHLPFRKQYEQLKAQLDTFNVASSYGLFRRMTGVGSPKSADKKFGWAGQPPSAVAVPALVVEASLDGKIWKEIPFRYTPGPEDRMPRRTAPHQPRLDWQMWFAALGSYQSNPWLLHLAYKIVTVGRVGTRGDKYRTGSFVLENLLDGEKWPFNNGEQPSYVRMWKYHYDFTRMDTEWSRKLAGGDGWIAPEVGGSHDHHYWRRKRISEYLPVVGESQFAGVVKQLGYDALAPTLRCGSGTGSFISGSICNVTASLRAQVRPWRVFAEWTIEDNGGIWQKLLYSGSSTVDYIDGPMVFVCVCGFVLPLALRLFGELLSVALTFVFRFPRHVVSKGVGPSKHLKAE